MTDINISPDLEIKKIYKKFKERVKSINNLIILKVTINEKMVNNKIIYLNKKKTINKFKIDNTLHR